MWNTFLLLEILLGSKISGNKKIIFPANAEKYSKNSIAQKEHLNVTLKKLTHFCCTLLRNYELLRINAIKGKDLKPGTYSYFIFV